MKALQSFKSEEVRVRILKMLYAAAYSEIYSNVEWRDYAFDEFNRLASSGDFLSRTFNGGGRLFLCFSFKWLMNKGIVLESDRLGEVINRLFYRNEIIWDCPPDMISSIDSDIDGEAVVMLALFNENETLERYALQEKMIAHLNGLDRILSGESKFVELSNIHPLMICSMLHFVMECDKKKIYPFRTANIKRRIIDLWQSMGERNWYDIIFEYIRRGDSASQCLTGQLYKIAIVQDEIAMFLFLHGMSDVCGIDLSEQYPSPEEVKGKWGHWLCGLDVMLKSRRYGK